MLVTPLGKRQSLPTPHPHDSLRRFAVFGPEPHEIDAGGRRRASSVAAVPRRQPVLIAKALVFSAVVFAVSLVSTFAAFLLGQVALASTHEQATLNTPGAVRAIFGGALYLTLIGLLAVGLGFLIRNTNWTMSLYLFWMRDDVMGTDYAMVSAMGVFYVLPSVVLYTFMQKYLTQMPIGGVKG